MQDEIKSGIYCIENKINHKKYIGQSVDIFHRWKQHTNNLKNGKHQNEHLQSAWNKYGEENFEFYILEECSSELLDGKENYWMDYYNTLDRIYGYNKKSGGQNGGSKYSEESRKKMSESQKDWWSISENMNEKRTAYKIAWADEEYRASRSGENHPMYGKHHSDETKKKLSNKLKGRSGHPTSQKTIDAIKKANIGRTPYNKNTTLVRCIELNLIFADAITAGKALNIKCPNHVIDVCMGRRKTCGGYHFEFVKNENNNG